MKNRISLFYKDAGQTLSLSGDMPAFAQDLQLRGILDIMCDKNNPRSRRVIASVLGELCQDPEDIAYRSGILQDFLQAPQLLADLKLLFARIDSAERDRQASLRIKDRVSAEYKTAKDVGVFLAYCEIYDRLAASLHCHSDAMTSEGLKALSETVCNHADSENFKELKQILRSVKQCCKGYLRLKLEVRTDASFKLTMAEIVDMDSSGFGTDSLAKANDVSASWPNGIKKLFDIGNKKAGPCKSKTIDDTVRQNADEIKNRALSRISSMLEAMASSMSSFLKNLSDEILFYEGARRLLETMDRLGLVAVNAEILPAQERRTEVEGLYDLSFALYLADCGCDRPMEAIVANACVLSDCGRIQIITGPNQGGKTTYIRALGILQMLAQAGIPVPASNAKISPADAILTHFPVDERPESNEGRLGEELDRMRRILENATPRSLILMNESFASTNSREGSRIAEDVLVAFAVIRARCAFVTHLAELAERVEEINGEAQKIIENPGRLVSMTARFEESAAIENRKVRKRTYQILPGAPAKSSFAVDIAEQYGIQYLVDKANKF